MSLGDTFSFLACLRTSSRFIDFLLSRLLLFVGDGVSLSQ